MEKFGVGGKQDSVKIPKASIATATTLIGVWKKHTVGNTSFLKPSTVTLGRRNRDTNREKAPSSKSQEKKKQKGGRKSGAITGLALPSVRRGQANG